MMPSPLVAPARHAPLAAEPWSDDRARAELVALVEGIEASYRGPDLLWPNHPGDLDGDPDVPMRTLYMGAGGIVWALARLARTGHAAPRIDLAALAGVLVEGWRAAPEFTSLYPAPQPSLLMGESGLLVLADAVARDGSHRGRLADCIAGNARNPTWELLWGSPGTMLAALELARGDDGGPWATAWRASAALLVEAWTGDVWEQDMYGTRARYVGAGHGFAGNVHALLRGRHLLDPAVAAEVERRAIAVLVETAQQEGPCVQWPALLGRELPPEKIRTQWCHGATGMVVALGGVLARRDDVDALLVGGGETAWRAGPLAANASLCHGTAGAGYAFLRLHARTGDERWLDRARAFALHAAAQARAARTEAGPRPALFTGDAGVALLLAACLDADPRFPVLDGLAP